MSSAYDSRGQSMDSSQLLVPRNLCMDARPAGSTMSRAQPESDPPASVCSPATDRFRRVIFSAGIAYANVMNTHMKPPAQF